VLRGAAALALVLAAMMLDKLPLLPRIAALMAPNGCCPDVLRAG
jgi:hypothetical protein